MRRRVHRGRFWRPARTSAAAGLAALVTAGAAACAATDDGAIVLPSVTSADETSDRGEDGSTLAPSEATVQVDDVVYRFAVTCHALGAGDLLVLGVAEDPESERLVEMYLQAFIADPYIGLRVGDGKLIEAALDAPLDLYIQDDVIRASAVRFVHSLDLGTGESESAGLGELEVSCSEYSRGLPTAGL